MRQELKTARRVLVTLVAPGLTTEKEWLMPDSTRPTPAASREPVKLGDDLPGVLAEMRRIQREREGR